MLYPGAVTRTFGTPGGDLALGDDFTRLVLPDPMSGTLAGTEPAGQYLSGDDARQTAARILAHGQGGWLT